MNEPLVTISIPTFQSGAFLRRCLEAIKNQTYKKIEVNIIDGGSKDETIDIAHTFGVEPVYYSDALLGARKQGVQLASGEFVLLLDCDQILENTAIERALQQIEKDSLDMLVFEEDVFEQKTLIEKLFHCDRVLVHMVKDFNPYSSVMLPRFYRTELIKKVFDNIPSELPPKVGGQDHAIIYLEAWNISQKVQLLLDAVKHIEPSTLKAIWKKFYRWGFTSVSVERSKYTELLDKKERFRKGLFTHGYWKVSFGSILLLLLKGVPYKLGRLFALRGDTKSREQRI